MTAIRTLGDLALSCGQAFGNKFLPQTFNILNAASIESIKVPNEQLNEAELEFVRDLRIELMKVYSTSMLAAEESNKLAMIEMHLGSIFDFVEKVILIENYSHKETTKTILSFVGDILSLFTNSPVVKSKAGFKFLEQSIVCL